MSAEAEKAKKNREWRVGLFSGLIISSMLLEVLTLVYQIDKKCLLVVLHFYKFITIQSDVYVMSSNLCSQAVVNYHILFTEIANKMYLCRVISNFVITIKNNTCRTKSQV